MTFFVHFIYEGCSRSKFMLGVVLSFQVNFPIPTANFLMLSNCNCGIISPHNCNCERNCIPPQATASTIATAAHKSSTSATARTNGDLRPGTTASKTANDGFRQPQLQLRLQLHIFASQLHSTATASISNN